MNNSSLTDGVHFKQLISFAFETNVSNAEHIGIYSQRTNLTDVVEMILRVSYYDTVFAYSSAISCDLLAWNVFTV